MQPLKEYKNILVFNPSFIGDSVLTTPLIKGLKKLYPQGRITFCVRPESADLFKGLPFIDEVLVYDKRGRAKGIKGALSFAAYVKKRNFDLAVNVHKSFRSTMIMKLAGLPYVVGFKSAVMSFLFDKTVVRDMTKHEVERNLALLAPLCSGFSLEKAKELGGRPECYIDKDLSAKAKLYFNSVSGDKKIIGISPGSVWATKRYPAEHFAETAKILTDKGFAVALFGSSSDIEAVDNFYKHFRGECYDFVSKSPIGELPALLSCLDVFITNDSGPMHIASGAGVPCVAIFGATVPSIGFAPYDDKSIIVENLNIDCRPCAIHGGNKCPKGHFKCMKDISPQQVAASAIKLWERN